jgi:hypothetical protein
VSRNFDELLSDDRTFTVRGQTFTWIEQRPEVISGMSTALEGIGDEEDQAAAWARIDDQILLFLIPEDHDRWRELRSRTEEPVTIKQINAIISYLVEEQVDRPTPTPSPSASGRGRTARSSTAA